VLNYPRGKVLGGCSSINGMIYMRGQAADYDTVWAPALKGQGGWSWAEVLPYFVRSEDYHDDAAAAAVTADGAKIHGQGNEWRVERQRVSWEILDAFREAAAEHGIPKVEDFNRGDNLGSRCVRYDRSVGW
jgi:choline dehydrogenase